MDKISSYKCTECQYNSYWHFALQKHETQHHFTSSYLFNCSETIPESYKCVHCSFHSNFKVNLTKAIESHECDSFFSIFPSDDKIFVKEAESSVSLKCKKCSFVTWSQLKIHKHSAQCNLAFKCAKCSFVANSGRTLTRHLEQDHRDSEDVFSCGQCSVKCNTKFNLLQHMIDDHSNIVRGYKCAKCCFIVDSQEDLKTHFIHAHMSAMFDLQKLSPNSVISSANSDSGISDIVDSNQSCCKSARMLDFNISPVQSPDLLTGDAVGSLLNFNTSRHISRFGENSNGTVTSKNDIVLDPVVSVETKNVTAYNSQITEVTSTDSCVANFEPATPKLENFDVNIDSGSCLNICDVSEYKEDFSFENQTNVVAVEEEAPINVTPKQVTSKTNSNLNVTSASRSLNFTEATPQRQDLLKTRNSKRFKGTNLKNINVVPKATAITRNSLNQPVIMLEDISKTNCWSRTPGGFIKCRLCPFKTKSAGTKLISRHLKHKHPKILESFSVEAKEGIYSGNKISEKYALREKCHTKGENMIINKTTQHVNVHRQDTEWNCCNYCDFKTVFKYNLARHQEGSCKEHLLKKHGFTFNCADCEFVGKTKRSLTIHVRKKHNLITRKFQCTVCQAQFQTNGRFVRHLRVKHLS